MFKRVFDFAVALLVGLFLLPVFVVIYISVAFALGRPVLFKQTRPGLHGRLFMMYKFRSMRDAIDSEGKPLPDKQRLGKFGRLLRSTSLDELPELWNVIRGDMSLVGPRPLLVDYLPLYNSRQVRRHEVRPGITGWAQVNGRNAISWEQKFELDVWYVENQSFWLDLKILYLTVLKVLKRDGIVSEGQATTEKFRGGQ